MFDILRILIARLRPAKSLEHGLCQIITPRLVKKVRRHAAGGSLIDALVREEDFDPDALGHAVADRLGMRFVRELQPPSRALVTATGYSSGQLESCLILPQANAESRAGYRLVVADPATLNIEEYRLRGVTVELGLGEEIISCWRQYHEIAASSTRPEVSEAQALAVLRRVAKDAEALGAREVFIGHPDQSSYEFISEEQRYTGSIHRSVFEKLLSSLGESSSTSVEAGESGGRSLYLARTKNFSHTVLFVSWDLPHPPEAKVEGEEQEIGEETVSGVAEDDTELNFDALETRPAQSLYQVESSVETNNTSPLVLVLEDDPGFATILRGVLEKRGYSVVHHSDARAALDYLEQSGSLPDLIISDVHMPSMDGGEFLTRIRERGAEAPVLMLTSDDDAVLEADLVAAGADAFVRKHDDVRVLLAWCGNLAKRSTTGGLRHAR